MRIDHLRLLAILFLLLFPSIAAAQAEPTLEEMVETTKPVAMLSLPSPKDRSAKVLLDDQNVEQYKELLIEPLMQLIKNKQLVARLFNSLDFVWQNESRWQTQSLENPSKFDLDSSWNLIVREGQTPQGGLPFGLAANINQEQSPERRAYKILWNILSAEGAADELLYETELDWFAGQALLRQSKGVFYRRFFFEPYAEEANEPKEASAVSSQNKPAPSPSTAVTAEPLVFSGGSDIFRQDLLQLVSPPVVFGYAQVCWRFRGSAEDRDWVFSPVIGKSRTVLSSNRSDQLMEGTLTMDDLLVWATKLQTVGAKVVAEKVLLVPFPAVSYYLADFDQTVGAATGMIVGDASSEAQDSEKDGQRILAAHGYHQRPDGDYAMTLFNYEGKRFEGAAPWDPLTAVFVPRKVWVVELEPKDPYYSSGRELLIVDQESMLPVYKIVYDYYGNYQKLVLGAWTQAVTKDEKQRVPFAAFVLGVENGGTKAMAFSTQNVRFFRGQSGKVVKELRGLLDIKRHAQRNAAQADKSATKDIEAPEDLQSELQSQKDELRKKKETPVQGETENED